VVLVVLDTNVLVAGLRSRRGSSFRVLELIGTEGLELAISVPLLLEYEDALSRAVPGLSARDLAAFLDYVCAQAVHQPIHFLWRPFLKDPKDDMVAEVAFAAGAKLILTHNLKDFRPVTQLGISPMTPATFLPRSRRP
jgi:predicted nucleic acid-binding protein